MRARTARTGALFCLLGALFGLISAATPDAAVHDEDLLVIVSVLTAALALALVATGDRMPVAGFHLVAVLGTALASAAVYAWGTGPAYPPLPFLWVTIFVFYFFRLRAGAGAHGADRGRLRDRALRSRTTGRTQVDGWLAAVGTLTIGGLVVALLRDRARRHIERLAEFANRDPLTELLNRRGFEDAFDIELERARRSDAPLSLVVADLDGLARVNRRARARGGATRRCARWPPRSGRSSGASTAPRGWEERSSRCSRPTATSTAPTCSPSACGSTWPRRRRRRPGAHDQPRVATFPVPRELGRGAAARGRPGAPGRQGPRARPHGDLERRGVRAAGRAAAPRGGGETRVGLAALLSIAEALDVRDTGSPSHSQRVGRFAELTARELGLPPDTVERVRLAGILHDVGRVGIPDALARKRGPLSDRDWSWVQSHPEIGARMVETTEFDDIRSWILFHHERPDGRGYPAGPVRRRPAAGGPDPRGRRRLRGDDARASAPGGARRRRRRPRSCAGGPTGSSTATWSRPCCESSDGFLTPGAHRFR